MKSPWSAPKVNADDPSFFRPLPQAAQPVAALALPVFLLVAILSAVAAHLGCALLISAAPATAAAAGATKRADAPAALGHWAAGADHRGICPKRRGE